MLSLAYIWHKVFKKHALYLPFGKLVMIMCPKCNAPENCLRWQFWQGSTFRCSLCGHIFTTDIYGIEHMEFEGFSIATQNTFAEGWEPLIDVFEENDALKIYVELLADIKDKMQLKVAKDHIEILAGNFYKKVHLPTCNIEQEQVNYKFKNCLLEITIPKRVVQVIVV